MLFCQVFLTLTEHEKVYRASMKCISMLVYSFTIISSECSNLFYLIISLHKLHGRSYNVTHLLVLSLSRNVYQRFTRQ